MQLLWWTIAILFAYFALKTRQLQLMPEASLDIPPLVLTAMGASALTAIGVKAIAVNQAETNGGSPNAAPSVPNGTVGGQGAGIKVGVVVGGQMSANALPLKLTQ